MPQIELRGLSKQYGSTRALDAASLELERAEVHALLGENGAGKTTLVRALYGLVRPDAGEIRVRGVPVAIRGPRHALELGIGLVPQHALLVPALSVAENLMLGEPGAGWLSRAALLEQARRSMRLVGLDVDPDAPVERLPVSQQQRLEIGRALARGVETLILDEPTAVLAPSEVDDLLLLLGRLRANGRTIVFISHKMEEITAVCDRVTVLRAGRDVATLPVAGLDVAELGRLMVGDEPPGPGVPPETEPGEVALRLVGARAGQLAGVDLEVRAGEIVAIAGVEGNGQRALEELLAGVRALEAGRLELLREPLALLPGDRQRAGLVLGLSTEENLVLPDAADSAPPAFRLGLARPRVLRERARAAIERFAIGGGPGSDVSTLSGGNQQKVCVARALGRRPGLLVAVNPTRGLDLGATAAVREALRDAARAGGAVLLVSTDIDEVLELGTRVQVMFRGALEPVEPERRTRERIGERMLGERG